MDLLLLMMETMEDFEDLGGPNSANLNGLFDRDLRRFFGPGSLGL